MSFQLFFPGSGPPCSGKLNLDQSIKAKFSGKPIFWGLHPQRRKKKHMENGTSQKLMFWFRCPFSFSNGGIFRFQPAMLIYQRILWLVVVLVLVASIGSPDESRKYLWLARNVQTIRRILFDMKRG